MSGLVLCLNSRARAHLLVALVLSLAASAFAADRPIVGAIRWDAWTGGEVTEQVQRTLAPEKYHFRLPWFAEVLAPDRVRIDGSPQSVMDREIDFAADAGLDYWAFLIYPQSNSMSAALEQYLKSDKKARIKFCVILHGTLSAPTEKWPAERDRLLTLMRKPTYQRVLGDRPLVYMFHDGFLKSEKAGRLKELRDAAGRENLKLYLVYMGWNPKHDYALAAPAGFDAVSAYAYASSGRFDTYDQLAKATEAAYWSEAERAQVPLIPLVTSGWDKRPRIDNPVAWEKDHGYHKESRWISPPQPHEIAEHLKRGLQFVDAHPQVCPARAIIVYAWNEYDEGGWIAPTLGADGKPNLERLEALREILRPK
ncbi:MAG TPA: hypothetical protein VGP72_32670 [Planctomycetota bacterium]|jgi:hypothetical protein